MNLKNTKVYSLDEEVIRKYAELCDILGMLEKICGKIKLQ